MEAWDSGLDDDNDDNDQRQLQQQHGGEGALIAGLSGSPALHHQHEVKEEAGQQQLEEEDPLLQPPHHEEPEKEKEKEEEEEEDNNNEDKDEEEEEEKEEALQLLQVGTAPVAAAAARGGRGVDAPPPSPPPVAVVGGTAPAAAAEEGIASDEGGATGDAAAPVPATSGGGSSTTSFIDSVGPTKLAHVLAQARAQRATLLSLTGCLVAEQGGVVPSQLCELSSLTRLHLAKNHLTALPPLFGLLSNLVELDVSENRLAELPSSFSRLSSLEVLNLGMNELAGLPPEVGDLSSLRVLNLSFNRLAALPTWPLGASLTALVDLDLSANALTALPPALPPTLTSLHLTDNRLTALPDDFGLHVPVLRRLALARNALSALPASFPRLTRLRQLDLRDNRLASLPHDAHLLAKLKVLFLEGNPLRIPVPHLPEGTHRSFATNPSAIHAYLSLYQYGEGAAGEDEHTQRMNRENARQSLERMFTNIDPEVISSVLEACEGSANSAIEFLLSISETPAISAAAGSGISPAETGAASSPSAPGPAFSFSSLLQAIEEKIDEKIIGDDASRKARDRSSSMFTKVLNTIKDKINENQQLDPARDSDDLPTPVPITPELMAHRAARARVPGGRLSQSSTNNFLVYEKENNRMLRALCSRPEFRDLLNLTLLVPQDIVLDGVAITRDLLQTHIVQWEGTYEQSPLFSSLNDIMGSLSPDMQSIILSLSGEGSRKTADILREGQMEFEDIDYDVPLLLISSPLGHVDVLAAAAAPTSPSSPDHAHPEATSPSSPFPSGEAAGSRDSEVMAGRVYSSTAQFDLRLAAPLSLDAFLTKLHDKNTRQLRITIESFARSIQKRKLGTDDKEQILSFLSRTRQAILSHPLWRGISAKEADYTAQALEAVVYTKIYKSIFLSASDQERDRMLTEKMKKLAFVTPDMLGIPPRFCKKRMWAAAERELLMMNSVCSPTEKLRALLNACRLIIELLKSLDNTAGADDFLPHLCMVVLRAYPPHLHSNVRFIARYTAPEILAGETLYYYTQLVSVISFVENIDGSHLNMQPQDYARLYDGGGDRSTHPSQLPRPHHDASQAAATGSLALLRPQRVGASVHSREHTRFLTASLEDLRYSDVPQLLAAYKALAAAAAAAPSPPPGTATEQAADVAENAGSSEGESLVVVKVRCAGAEENGKLFRMVSFSPRAGIEGLRAAIAGRLAQKPEGDDQAGLAQPVVGKIVLLPDVALECSADVLLLQPGDCLEVTLSI
ncbi:leucine rich repeat domain containing protein [Acanthamoeba castellanii str. Neff]|uniref:Leucine rich repeat domain containing protein n=1 Tax=Acanthamoeba castellanii (strain ATCC 30010 / Neff) TaxID=1257118 RepID=L8GNS6_ACACF|nr:leucine rich repeat domain containing protein [Acanthamoeba castellanii str. Neff]ELR14609.1 leucine rich repeat domain containing protein [Acanthamoeba castellanii str. Neff]